MEYFRSAKRLALLLLALVFLTFGALVLASNSTNSLESKQKVTVESMSEVNNLVSSIAALNNPNNDEIANAEEVIYDIETALEKIGTSNPAQPNLVESIFARSSANTLKQIANNISESQSQSKLEAILNDIKQSEKFINYSPSSDFIAYRQDPENDSARIERGRLAMQELSDNQQLSQSFRSLYSEAESAYKKLAESGDLKAFISTITELQNRLITEVNEAIKLEKTLYSNIYNNILYQ